MPVLGCFLNNNLPVLGCFLRHNLPVLGELEYWQTITALLLRTFIQVMTVYKI
ncbi:hypothetical protein HMPREF3216_00869 [Gardnerella vaginalis]|uniref:Uncharacterized protein n=1 Tax=Gardnerella vaginalis TaxID=2702 RepID=A0A133NP77_GARVA|nr:hypothetical protein HMPREF3216_00869 [Gardnerella vaginalis]